MHSCSPSPSFSCPPFFSSAPPRQRTPRSRPGAASSWETPASSDAADASASPQPDTSETDTSAASKQGKPTTNAPIPAAAASAQTLTVLVGDKVQTMGLEDYLWGVVAAEMPATFEQEALNAQAIAARTYTLYRMASPSQTIQRPASAPIRAAVRRGSPIPIG